MGERFSFCCACRSVLLSAVGAMLLGTPGGPAVAAAEDEAVIEEVIVTGTRIRRDPLNEVSPVMELDEQYLDQTGVTNLGDMLQRLPVTTSALNTRFNVPGNSGFPQDGTGIRPGVSHLVLSSAIEEDIFEVLTLEGSVAARDHVGGTAPERVREASTVARKLLA